MDILYISGSPRENSNKKLAERIKELGGLLR
jgi:NAD(P)H-dependent FMN reductase